VAALDRRLEDVDRDDVDRLQAPALTHPALRASHDAGVR
jgi:hypothetical protein